MMDCKKALAETNGDVDEALNLLRKKGLATLAKRAGRETNQGIVYATYCPDGNVAVMVGLCCETDFVSKGDDFQAAVKKLAEYAMNCPDFDSIDAVMQVEVDGKKVDQLITELVS